MATSPDQLLALLHGEFSSLTIGFNEDHASNYKKADQWDFYDGDRIDWPSSSEKLKAIQENSVWTIQWYPNTPVGFFCAGGSTFESAVRHAFKIAGMDACQKG